MLNLTCPHRKQIMIENENGIQVYKHVDTGNYCSHLNTFAINTNEIYRKKIVTCLKEFKPELVKDFLEDFREANKTLVKKVGYANIKGLMSVVYGLLFNRRSRRGYNNIYRKVIKNGKYKVLFEIFEIFCRCSEARKQFYMNLTAYLKSNKEYKVEYMIYCLMCMEYYSIYCASNNPDMIGIKCCFEEFVEGTCIACLRKSNVGNVQFLKVSKNMPIIETYILFGEDAFINNIRYANLIFTKNYSFDYFNKRQDEIVWWVWNSKRFVSEFFKNNIGVDWATMSSIEHNVWKIHFSKTIKQQFMFDNFNELIYDLVDEKYIDRNLTGYYDAQNHYHDVGPIEGVKAAVKQISSDLSMMKDNKAKDSAKTLAKLAKMISGMNGYNPNTLWDIVGK